MMEKKEWALRRDPYTRQEVLQGPDGRFCGWVDVDFRIWDENGRSAWSDYLDLVPLQNRPEALRCWYKEGGGMLQWRTTHADGFTEMIERAPAEAMARALAGLDRDAQTAALEAYRAMYPEDTK